MGQASNPKEEGEGWTFNKSSFIIFLFFLPAFFFLILALLVGMQYKQFRAFVSPHPEIIAHLPKSPEAEAAVLAKVRGYFDPTGSPAKASSAGDTLALTSVDLNHLIRTSAALTELKWNYHLELEDTLLVARSSIPVENMRDGISFLLKLMRMKGYFNSVMRGHPSLAGGKITMVPVSAVMNGRPAPVSALNRNGNVDMREWVADKAFYDRALAGLAEIRIRGGALLLIKPSGS